MIQYVCSTLNRLWRNVSCFVFDMNPQTSTRCSSNVVLMLDQRRRRWNNIKATIAYNLLSVGIGSPPVSKQTGRSTRYSSAAIKSLIGLELGQRLLIGRFV